MDDTDQKKSSRKRSPERIYSPATLIRVVLVVTVALALPFPGDPHGLLHVPMLANATVMTLTDIQPAGTAPPAVLVMSTVMLAGLCESVLPVSAVELLPAQSGQDCTVVVTLNVLFAVLLGEV